MADKATIEPIASTMIPPQGSGKGLLRVGGKITRGGHDVSLAELLIKNQQFLPTNNIPIENGEEVELRGRGLDLYDRVGFALTEDGPSFNIAYKDLASGDAFLRFNIKDLQNNVKDGGEVWLKLLAPPSLAKANVTIGPHVIYFFEEPEDAKDGKKSGAGKNRAASARQSQGGVGTFVSEALGGTIGGITGALKSAGGTTAAGAKTISQTGTASATTTKQVSSAGTADVNGEIDYDDETQSQTEIAQSLSSTAQVSTGGQTISQGGTVSASTAGSVAASGTAEVGQTARVSSTTSAGASVVAQGSTVGAGGGTAGGQISQTAQGTVTQGQTISASGTAAGSGNLRASGQVAAPGGGASGAEVSIKAEGQPPIQSPPAAGKVSAQGQGGAAGAGGKISAQGQSSAGLGTNRPAVGGVSGQSAGGTGGVGAGRQVQGQAKAQTSGQSAAGAGSNQTAGTALPGKGKIDGISSTGALGGGLPQFPGGATPVSPSFKPMSTPTPGAIGQGSSNLGSAGLPPPPGMKDILGAMQKNQEALGSKLNLPQKDTGDKIASAPVVQPRANLQDAQGAAEAGKENAEDGQQDSAPPETGGPGGPPAQPLAQGPQSNIQNQPEGAEQGPNQAGEEEDENSEVSDDDQDRQPIQPPAKVVPEAAVAALGPEAALAANAINAAAGSELGQALIGEATGTLWKVGFATACATFFLGLDFFAGAIMMDIYWSRHSSQPKLFPMKTWQKAVTVFANIFPFIAVLAFFGLFMVVGCNYPVPKSNYLPTYRGSILGNIIGDDCKYFDASSIIANSTTAGGQTNQSASQSPSPVTPRGSTP